MTRKKVTLRYIMNDSARRASLKKRRVGLMKKVSELSTLCGVSASVIIYSPDDNQPTTWPSPPEVRETLARFHSVPETERSKKMTDHETYLKEKVRKLEEQIRSHRTKNKDLEGSNLMHNIYQDNGLHKLGVNDMHFLSWYAHEKRKEIKKKIDFQQGLSRATQE